MSETFVNKVAESGIITLDPANYLPKDSIRVFDLKDHLFMGLILKEKDFREALKSLEWEQYRSQHVALTCSADAIIPVWAYMLVAANLEPVAASVTMGNEQDVQKKLFLANLATIPAQEYTDQRVVIKGCGETPIPDYVYMELTRILRPVAKSIMYGEPCSTVPVFKKK
jgi:hypothetical protein